MKIVRSRRQMAAVAFKIIQGIADQDDLGPGSGTSALPVILLKVDEV